MNKIGTVKIMIEMDFEGTLKLSGSIVSKDGVEAPIKDYEDMLNAIRIVSDIVLDENMGVKPTSSVSLDEDGNIIYEDLLKSTHNSV